MVRSRVTHYFRDALVSVTYEDEHDMIIAADIAEGMQIEQDANGVLTVRLGNNVYTIEEIDPNDHATTLYAIH